MLHCESAKRAVTQNPSTPLHCYQRAAPARSCAARELVKRMQQYGCADGVRFDGAMLLGAAGRRAAQALDQFGGRIGIRRQTELDLRLLDRGAGAGADFAVDFADAS